MTSAGEIIRTTYRNLLSSDEWKSFSSDIRRARGGACECCRRKDVPTQVHHYSYEPGKSPADICSDDVALLCTSCHQALHKQLTRFRKIVFRQCPPKVFEPLNTALAIGLRVHDPLAFAYAVMEMAYSPRSVENFKNAWINRKPEDRPIIDDDQIKWLKAPE